MYMYIPLSQLQCNAVIEYNYININERQKIRHYRVCEGTHYTNITKITRLTSLKLLD